MLAPDDAPALDAPLFTGAVFLLLGFLFFETGTELLQLFLNLYSKGWIILIASSIGKQIG